MPGLVRESPAVDNSQLPNKTNSQLPNKTNSQISIPREFERWNWVLVFWELVFFGSWGLSYRIIIPDVMIMSTMRPIGAGGRMRKNAWNDTGLSPCVGRSTPGTL